MRMAVSEEQALEPCTIHLAALKVTGALPPRVEKKPCKSRGRRLEEHEVLAIFFDKRRTGVVADAWGLDPQSVRYIRNGETHAKITEHLRAGA